MDLLQDDTFLTCGEGIGEGPKGSKSQRRMCSWEWVQDIQHNTLTCTHRGGIIAGQTVMNNGSDS